MIAIPATPAQLPLLCDYIYQKIEVKFDPASVQGFAILSDTGAFVAGVLFSNVRTHNGRNIDVEITCATDHSVTWTPGVCRAVFGYAFGTLGCVRVTAITRKNNTKCRAFLDALNFALEGTIRKGYDGEKDALIYGLLAENCAFFGD